MPGSSDLQRKVEEVRVEAKRLATLGWVDAEACEVVLDRAVLASRVLIEEAADAPPRAMIELEAGGLLDAFDGARLIGHELVEGDVEHTAIRHVCPVLD